MKFLMFFAGTSVPLSPDSDARDPICAGSTRSEEVLSLCSFNHRLKVLCSVGACGAPTESSGIIILGRNRMDLEDLKAQGMPGQSGLLCLSPGIKNWIQVT